MRPREAALGALLMLTACGPKAPAPARPTDALSGRWERGDDALDWLQVGPSTVGVLLPAAGSFRVWVINAGFTGPLTVLGPVGPHADLYATSPRGEWGEGSSRIALSVSGDVLTIAQGDDVAAWTRAEAAPEPGAEAADRAFAADASARGADAWADAFAPDGSTWSRPGGRRTGGAAVADGVRGLYATPGVSFVWDPTASGRSVDGSRAWTLGRYRVEADGREPSTGTYLSIWAHADGRWAVAFDTGFPDP